MTAERCTCFVYYRVPEQDAARLDAAFREMRDRLQAPAERPIGGMAGPVVTLSRRLDPTSGDRSRGATTWLEIHEFDGNAIAGREAVDRWIESHAVAAGVAALAVDGRRVEWFVACA